MLSALCTKWCLKWSHSLSLTSLSNLVRLQYCEKRQWAGALLSINCCCFVWKPLWRVPQFWTSPCKKNIEEERKKNILAIWWLSGSLLLWCTTRHVVGYEKHSKMNGTLSMSDRLLSLLLLRFCKNLFLYYHLLCVSTIPIYTRIKILKM